MRVGRTQLLRLLQARVAGHDNDIAQLVASYLDDLDSAPTEVLEVAQLGACDIVDPAQVSTIPSYFGVTPMTVEVSTHERIAGKFSSVLALQACEVYKVLATHQRGLLRGWNYVSRCQRKSLRR